MDRGEDRLSLGGWTAAAVLVAVAAAVDPWGFRPFTTARWAVLGILVCLAAAGARWRLPGPAPVSGSGRLLAAAWIGLLAWLGVAAALGVDPLLAVVGHPRRHLGLAGWVVGALAFAAGTGLGPADVRRGLGRAAVVAGIVTGAAAIADLAGWDPAGVAFAGGRTGGLLGQPVYLGAGAVLLVPVALGVAVDPAAGVAWRRAAVAAAAGGVVALLASQTRGAWLGAAVAAAVTILAAHVPARRPRPGGPEVTEGTEQPTVPERTDRTERPATSVRTERTERPATSVRTERAVRGEGAGGAQGPAGSARSTGSHEAAGSAQPAGAAQPAQRAQPVGTAVRGWLLRRRPSVVAAVAAGVVVLAGLVVAGPLSERVSATFDPSGSARGRLDEWALALSVVADHPLAGVGPEGYRVVAPSHVDDAYTRAHGRDEVVDRAHNGPLDVAVSGGLPAAGLYVALLAGVVVRCVQVLRRPPGPVVTGAAAGVVAWVVQQMVSFPVAEVDPAAWLLAGAAATAAPAPGLRTSSAHRSWPIVAPVPGLEAGSARRWRRIAGPAAGLVTSSARRWSRIAGPRRAAALRGQAAVAGRVVAGALAAVLAVGGLLAVAADRELRRAEQRVAGAGGGDAAAVAAADRATDLRPHDVDAWYVAARVASARPGLLAVDAGLARVERGLRRSPRDPALRSLEEELLVERALRSGLPEDLRAARAAARARVAEDPAGPAHHRHLGLVLAAGGGARNVEEAATALRRALALDPDDQVARRALDDLPAR